MRWMKEQFPLGSTTIGHQGFQAYLTFERETTEQTGIIEGNLEIKIW